MIMKKFKNSLAAFAFATASLGAFAFSPQGADANLTLFANQNGSWVPTSGAYRCIAAAQVCVAQFENNQPGGKMVYSESGRYTK